MVKSASWLAPKLWLAALVTLAICTWIPAPALALQDAFKDAKKEYDAGEKENSPAKMSRAVLAMGAAGTPEARDFLLDLLAQDQKARKGKKPGLPGDVRKNLISAMGSFSDEASVVKIGEAIAKIDSLKDPSSALDQFDLFFPLARMEKSESAMQVITGALSNPKNPYVKVAALEAVRQGGNQRFVDAVVAILREDNKEWWEKWKIVPINVFACLEVIAATDVNDAALKAVTAAAELAQKWEIDKVEPDERTRYFAGRMLKAITGERADITAWKFWSWWAAQKKATGKVVGGAKAPERRPSKTASPPVFNTAPVGTRYVFCIDVSLSMNMELKINLDEIEKRKPQKPTTGNKKQNVDPEEQKRQDEEDARVAEEERKRGIDSLKKLPWKSITTKMELAREELARAIESMPEGFFFAVVTYSTNVDCITGGFIKSDKDSRGKWAKAAREMEPEALTNIHGGLMASLRLGSSAYKPFLPEHPSVDPDCVTSGADTIIFLTDGWGSWSDDSNGRTAQDPRNPKDPTALIGDGTHILGKDIWPDIARQNLFRKVVINTVGIGYHDEECLKNISNDSGGTYIDWGFKE